MIAVPTGRQDEFERLLKQANEHYLKEEMDQASALAEQAVKLKPQGAVEQILIGGNTDAEIALLGEFDEATTEDAKKVVQTKLASLATEGRSPSETNWTFTRLWQYLDEEGKEWGPLSTSEIQRGVVLGHIKESTLVNRTGSKDKTAFKPLTEFAELAVDETLKKDIEYMEIVHQGTASLLKGGSPVDIAPKAIEAIESLIEKPQAWLLLADCHSHIGNLAKAYGCYINAMNRSDPGSFIYCKSALNAYELITDPTITGRPDDWPKPDWVEKPHMLYYVAIQVVAVLGGELQATPGAWRMKADALNAIGDDRAANSAYARARHVLAARVRMLAGQTIGGPSAIDADGNKIEDTDAETTEPWGSAAAMLEKSLGITQGLVADEKGEVAIPVRSYAPMARPPLGIGGVSGRWAGGINHNRQRDAVQMSMGDALGDVPAQRYSIIDLASSMEGTLTSTQDACVRHGGFVSGAQLFDSSFFGISPAEAAAIDPQQRLLLEHGFTALHMSTYRKITLMGGDTGTFLGIERPDWSLAQPPAARASVYAVTGDNVSAAAGRISFCLGLQGPCASIDTACSSALVAVHQGGNAVLKGECGAIRSEEIKASGLTLAVSLKLTPHANIGAASAGMLSVDGRCKTLDASANGYMRSESIGAMCLRHYEDATGKVAAPYDPVLASTEVRQDGRSASLTAPNGSAQRILHDRVLNGASISTSEIGWIETHGTGTPLGDPTETGAIATVHSNALQDGQEHRRSPLVVMAAKANVGHSESPSGFVGLLRVYFQMLGTATCSLYGNAKLRSVNPLVDEAFSRAAQKLKGGPYDVTTFAMPIQPLQHQVLTANSTCFAGISSFGFSGTIAHAVIRHANFDEPYRAETLALSRLEKRLLAQWGMEATF